MTTAERKARIRAFTSRFLRNHEIADNEDMFAAGLVSSLFAMQLVLFIEKEFSVAIGSDDLAFDNFRTIDAMSALVERKSGPPAATAGGR